MKSLTTLFNCLPFSLLRISTLSNFKSTRHTFLLIILLACSFSNKLKATDISGTYVADITLTAADSPYILTGDVLVDVGVTMTIEPGVEIQINNTGRDLEIYGTLQALGTPEGHILFISNAVNGGGSVVVRENGVANLEYVDFEKLGTTTLSAYETGLYLYDSEVTADNLTFTNCGLDGGTIHIISDANSMEGFGSNNNVDQVRLLTNTLDVSTLWPNINESGFSYVLTGDQVVDVLETLTIEPGVTVNLSNTGSDIIIYGNLIAEGEPGSHITLMSTHGNGGGSLALHDASIATIEYVDFENLGTTTLSFYEAGLYIYEAGVVADNLIFSNCGLQDGTIGVIANAQSISDFGPNNAVDQVRLITNTLSETSIWPKMDPGEFNYLLTGDQVVGIGTTLTIESGVEINLSNTGSDIIVNGTLSALGTLEAPIRLYSTHGNGGGSLAFLDGSVGDLHYIDFEELGRTTLSFYESGLYIYDAQVSADFLTFLNCGVNDISIDSEPWAIDNFGPNNLVDQVRLRTGTIVKNSTWPLMDAGEFNYNMNNDILVDVGFELTIEPGVEIDFSGTNRDLGIYGSLNAAATESDSIRLYSSHGNGGGSLVFHDNATGILDYVIFEDLARTTLSFWEAGLYLLDASVEADNLNFINSGVNGQSITALPWVLDDFGNSNAVDRVKFISDVINKNSIWPNLDPSGFSYFMTNDVTVNENYTLTIQPGVDLDFNATNRDLLVYGTLLANGTAEDSIRFYSTHGNGGGSVVLFAESVDSEIRYARFSDLGRTSLSSFDASLYLYNGELILEKSIITDSQRGLTIESGQPTINANIIKDNSNLGINNFAANGIVNACNNYWGDPSGPFNATNNPAGLGNGVSDNVLAADCAADALEIICPDNASVNVGEDYSTSQLGGVEVCIQDCEALLSIAFVDSNLDPQCTEDMTRTWTVIDDCGNQMSCDQIISFTDVVDPTIVCPPDVELDCNEEVPAVDLGLIEADDNCEVASLILESEVENTVGCVHTFTRTFEATDPTGNTTSCSYDIEVKIDLDAPVLSEMPENQSVSCSDYPAAPGVTAIDACDGPVEVIFDESASEDPCILSLVRTWTATDECGNVVMHTQIITGERGPIVLIGVPANETIECTDLPLTVPTVTASDDCGPVGVTFSEVTDGEFCDGTITRTWTAIDDCGNTASESRIITVVKYGCLDPLACNYDDEASVENDICSYAEGCDECSGQTDGTGAVIDNPEVGDSCDDGDDTTVNDMYVSCDICEGIVIPGCTNPIACNYDEAATVDNETCVLAEGCDECDGAGGVTDNPEVGDSCDDGDETTLDDIYTECGVCAGEIILGCTNPIACNYDEAATVDNDTCVLAEGCDECDGAGGVTDNPEVGDSCDDGDETTLDDIYTECGVCAGEIILGCTNEDACNYDETATIDNDTCVLAEGCDECDGAGGVIDNPEIGDACDDGDETTFDDIYTECGVCAGEIILGCTNEDACNFDETATVDNDTCVLAEGCDECDGAGGVTDNPEIGDSCDDGDETTLDDIYTECGVCAGEIILGCTNEDACNYDETATVYNDTCVLAEGCDECDGAGGVIDNPEIGDACNDGDETTLDDIYTECGVCAGEIILGCTNEDACNYDETATVDNDTCVLAEGCDECDGAGGLIDNPEVGDSCDDGDETTLDDIYTECGVCGGTAIPGCTNPEACNYDDAATVDNDTCVLAEGCDECDGAGGVTDNPEIGDSCDDGDDNTFDDVYVDCGICAGEICDVAAAEIEPTSPTIFCNSDEVDDTFTFNVVGGNGDEALLLGVELDGTILGVLLEEPINLNGGAPGEFLIYHMYLNGSPELVGGDNISNLVGCFELSEPIMISIVTGEDCPMLYDCPEIGLNFGDDCDDGDESTTNDFVNENCFCEGTLDCVIPNDEIDGSLPNVAERLWGVPGWDTFEVGCATLSAQACDGTDATSDTWYSFVAQAENQGILVRPNPSDNNAANVDLAIEVFDSSYEPLDGSAEGNCEVSRSCFNNYGNGKIERCVPTGLTIGETYYYRVYDANGPETGEPLLLDTKVKTYSDHTIVDGCDGVVEDYDHTWQIESPVNLYNIPPVPVFFVRMAIKDLDGNVVAMSDTQSTSTPNGLIFSYADFSPELPDGNYTVHAQNQVKMMANGCVSAFWSQLGPGCEVEIGLNGPGDLNAGLIQGLNSNPVQLTVFPNPNTGDQVYINLSNMPTKTQLIQVELIDLFGKLVYQEMIPSNGEALNHTMIFDKSIATGIYLVRVNIGNESVFKKLIIE